MTGSQRAHLLLRLTLAVFHASSAIRQVQNLLEGRMQQAEWFLEWALPVEPVVNLGVAVAIGLGARLKQSLVVGGAWVLFLVGIYSWRGEMDGSGFHLLAALAYFALLARLDDASKTMTK